MNDAMVAAAIGSVSVSLIRVTKLSKWSKESTFLSYFELCSFLSLQCLRRVCHLLSNLLKKSKPRIGELHDFPNSFAALSTLFSLLSDSIWVVIFAL